MQVQHIIGLHHPIPDLPAIEQNDYTTRYDGNHLLDHQDALLDAWLAIPDFTCCSLQTGFHITIDDYPERYDTLDHFWHMSGWFHAMKHILAQEEATFTTFVWDESSLTMQRHGSMITMYDGYPALDRYTFRPVTFALRPFADLLVREGQISVNLMRGLMQHLITRGYDADQLLTRIEPLGDKPHPASDDLELKAAIIYRELDQPAYFDLVAEAADLLTRLE